MVRPWLHSINIKQYLDPNKPLADVVAGVLREIDRLPEDLRNSSLALENVRDIFEEAIDLNDTDVFDDGLSELYDWADDNRVWLGIGGPHA